MTKTRGRALGVERLTKPKKQAVDTPVHPSWWPEWETVGEKLQRAMDRGHRFSGVDVAENGSRTWRCEACGKTVKRVFEQDERWGSGVGNWAVKADVVGWQCR